MQFFKTAINERNIFNITIVKLEYKASTLYPKYRLIKDVVFIAYLDQETRFQILERKYCNNKKTWRYRLKNLATQDICSLETRKQKEPKPVYFWVYKDYFLLYPDKVEDLIDLSS